MKILRVLGDYAVLLAGAVAGRAIAFVTITLLARSLGKEGLGTYGTGITIAGYLLLISNLGLDSIGLRSVAGSEGRVREIVLRIRVLRLSLGVVLGLVGLLTVIAVRGPLVLAIPLSLLGITLAFRDDWLLLAVGRSLSVSVAGVCRELVFVAVVALIVLRSPSAVSAAWAYLGADACWAIATQIMIRRTASAPPAPATPNYGALVRGGIPIAVMGLMTLTYTKIDTPIIALLRGPGEAGVYFAAYGILFAVQSLLTPLTRAAIPEMAKLESGGVNASQVGMFRVARLATSLGGLFAGGILITSNVLLTLLYGPEYVGGELALRLLAWSIPFTAASSILQQGLIIQDRHQKFALLGGLAAATNVCLNILLVPAYGMRGAAVATIVSEAALFLGAAAHFVSSLSVRRLVLRLATVLIVLGTLTLALRAFARTPTPLLAVVALLGVALIGAGGHALERRLSW